MGVAVFRWRCAKLFAETLAEVAGIAHTYHKCDFRYGVAVVFEEDGGFASTQFANIQTLILSCTKKFYRTAIIKY